MGKKSTGRKGTGQAREAAEVFRQFAWNIAGTLKKPGVKAAPSAKPDGRA
ncbi:hypothetical protein [Pelagibacterium xiamenense]|nr:hypothetical protein [Pelagibacterium xiamenense]MCD7059486.1 hypothetical protein [Pelagibacterium xiamenense]